MKSSCVYCGEPLAARALVCKECGNGQVPPWFARVRTHWITQLFSTAVLASIVVWLYQGWSAKDADRRQRMLKLAESAEVLQAATEELRQPCIASQETCQIRFIENSARFSVNNYTFTQEAGYFFSRDDPIRTAIDFIDDFYNPGKQVPSLAAFRYTPVQIAIVGAREALTTPFQNTAWCTAEHRAAIRTLSVSLDIYRYCQMEIRRHAWEEATAKAFERTHDRSEDDYAACTKLYRDPRGKSLGAATVRRSADIGDQLADMTNYDHSAPWLFDAYCGESGFGLGGGIIPPATRQLLVVTTSSWTATSGTAVRYLRNGDTPGASWKPVGSAIQVVIGKAGLGWGHSLMPSPVREGLTEPTKEEGDWRSPAGLFSIGSVYAQSPLPDSALPRFETTKDMYCDDRVNSAHYNQAVRLECAREKDCPTERLQRQDGVYRRLIWINYNSDPVVKSAGSCVFLHLNHADRSPTAGCTTVSPDDMDTLLSWLRPELHPLLLQLPQDVFAQWACRMNLSSCAQATSGHAP